MSADYRERVLAVRGAVMCQVPWTMEGGYVWPVRLCKADGFASHRVPWLYLMAHARMRLGPFRMHWCSYRIDGDWVVAELIPGAVYVAGRAA